MNEAENKFNMVLACIQANDIMNAIKNQSNGESNFMIPYTEYGKFLVYNDANGDFRVVIRNYAYGLENHTFLVGMNLKRSLTSKKMWVSTLMRDGEKVGFETVNKLQLENLLMEIHRIGNDMNNQIGNNYDLGRQYEATKSLLIENGFWI